MSNNSSPVQVQDDSPVIQRSVNQLREEQGKIRNAITQHRAEALKLEGQLTVIDNLIKQADAISAQLAAQQAPAEAVQK